MSVLTAYQRFRFLWGVVDSQSGSDVPYSPAQTGTNLGTSAAPGVGVGVRRVVLHFDRTSAVAGADDAECHFDFLNLTGGDPDDTWTNTDYGTLETALDTWWAAVKNRFPGNIKLSAYNWYRYGPGIVAPNPAERVSTRSVVATGSSTMQAPQDACSVTFRNAVRKSWGRTYLPGLTTDQLVASGKYGSTAVDAICNATAALYASANGSDFPMVVVSKHLSQVMAIEAIEVDDIVDVIRRRRWKVSTYRKIVNT